MVLEFHGSGRSESNTGDYREVEKERENPFELLVNAIDAVDSPIWYWLYPVAQVSECAAHASCRIPDAARMRGENPTLEMILAAEPEDPFTPMPPLIIRKVQKINRQNHPKKPRRPCLKRTYNTGKVRKT